MSGFKSKLPSFQEITHIAGKLFKDVKNSVSEVIDEYKQKRAESTTKQTETTTADVVSSSHAHASPETTTPSNTSIHKDTVANSRDSLASSSTPIITPIESQTIEPIDAPLTSDSPVNHEDSKKTSMPGENSASVEDNFSTQSPDALQTPNPTATPSEVKIEHHVDEKKPLKDDVL